jgi:hypothetical protein
LLTREPLQLESTLHPKLLNFAVQPLEQLLLRFQFAVKILNRVHGSPCGRFRLWWWC